MGALPTVVFDTKPYDRESLQRATRNGEVEWRFMEWRLSHFMIASDAFVVVPGGLGTLLELSLAWQLLQVRKLYNTPLILVGKMWADLVEWGRRTMLIEGSELASEVDFTIPHCVNTIDETIALIRENRAVWLVTQQAKSPDPQA